MPYSPLANVSTDKKKSVVATVTLACLEPINRSSNINCNWATLNANKSIRYSVNYSRNLSVTRLLVININKLWFSYILNTFSGFFRKEFIKEKF